MSGLNTLEELRLSYAEQDYVTAIQRVEHWLDTDGTALLKTCQRVPYNYEEAIEIRKQHEKLELKCAKFLAFFSQMSLKGFPAEYEQMRRKMDVDIQNFSDRIKARRHIVVTFYTFYRHIEELKEKVAKRKNYNLEECPDTVEDVKVSIETLHKVSENIAKRFGHLQEEKERALLAIDIMLELEMKNKNQYVDRNMVEKMPIHLNKVVRELEEEVIPVYEHHKLLENELEVESRILQIESDIKTVNDWLTKLKMSVYNYYECEVVGRSTMENVELQRKCSEFSDKFKEIYIYGQNLIRLHEGLSGVMKRDMGHIKEVQQSMKSKWESGQKLFTEYDKRLDMVHNMFLGLDETLTKIEDILLAIERDGEEGNSFDIVQSKYEPIRAEMHDNFNYLKGMASNVIEGIEYDLVGEKPNQDSNMEVKQTQATIKMKMFTLAVKLKDLDRHLGVSGNVSSNGFEGGSYGNKDIIQSEFVKRNFAEKPLDMESEDVDRYLQFLDVTQKNWESKAPPKTLEQAQRSVQEHKKLKVQSDKYWEQLVQCPINSDDLAVAKKQRNNWNAAWSQQMEQVLVPRSDFLGRTHELNGWLDDKLKQVEELSEQPNNTVKLVTPIVQELEKMDKEIPVKRKTIKTLMADSRDLYNNDMNNQIEALEEKCGYLQDQVKNNRELEKLIKQIEEFLPQIHQFKKKYNNNNDPAVQSRSLPEKQKLQNQINQFNVDRLKKLSKDAYGSTKKVEWLIKELQLDDNKFGEAVQMDDLIIPQREIREMASFNFNSDNYESSSDEIRVGQNEKAELQFNMDNLVKVDGDQYNVVWYKDDEPVLNDIFRAGKVNTNVDPEKATLTINDCQFDDSGGYRCEIINAEQCIPLEKSPTDFIHNDEMLSNYYDGDDEVDGDIVDGDYDSEDDNDDDEVVLHVDRTPAKSLIRGLQPQFPDIIYAPINEPLVLKMFVDADQININPMEDIKLKHNGRPVNCQPPENDWQKEVTKDGFVTFTNPLVSLPDGGEYHLVAGNRLIAKTQVKVGQSPTLIQPNFTMSANKNEDVNITIPLANVSMDSIDDQVKHNKKVKWAKDGYRISSGSNRKPYKIFNDVSGNPVLIIPNFNETDEGVYVCEITNEYGTQQAEGHLMLNREVSTPNRTHGTYSQKPSGNTDAISVNVGDPLNIDFQFKPTNKKPDIIWTKDDKIIKIDGRKFQTHLSNNSVSILQIKEITERDSGTYTAVDRNTNDRKSVRVEVMPKGCRPIIEDYPKKIVSKVDEKVEILCTVKSIPFANTVEWQFKCTGANRPTPLSSTDKRYRFINKPILESRGQKQDVGITINKINSTDAGEYILKCGNTIGWTSLRIPLVIVGDAMHKKCSPKFIGPLHYDIQVPLHGSARLVCKTSGNPTPQVTWTKDGHPISSHNNIEIDRSGERHELCIKRCTKADAGMYLATASNSLGKETCTCHVIISNELSSPNDEVDAITPTIIDRDFAMGSPKFNSGSDKSAPYYGEKRTQLVFSNTVVRSPPQFISTFSDEVVAVGSDVTLRCCLIGQPEPEFWWSYNTHFLKENPRFHAYRENDEYVLMMKNLQKSDAGRYSITAENSSGLATCSALVIVEHPEERRSKSLDRTLYPAQSKPLEGKQFPCHTTLGHTKSPRSDALSDDSRMIQVIRHGENAPNTRSSKSSPGTPQVYRNINISSESEQSDIDSIIDHDVDVKSTRTKTIRTYHYSGPSGVELPGVGFIPPHSNSSRLNNSDKNDDYSSDSTINNGSFRKAKFVPKEDRTNYDTVDAAKVTYRYNITSPDNSCVESSDCDFPL